jgi:hypothetical protein
MSEKIITVKIIDLSKNQIKGEMKIQLNNYGRSRNRESTKKTKLHKHKVIRSSKGAQPVRRKLITKPLKVPKTYKSKLLSDTDYIKEARLNPLKRKMERI